MKKEYPGTFIVLDGPEGAGKTTQVRLLVEWLKESGRQATAVRDPGSTPVSERIREVLLDSSIPAMDARTEMFLYMASRAEMVARIIRPALEVGLIVVSDRFISSTVAYQGYAGGIKPKEIRQVGRVACQGIEPDLTVILNLPVAEGFQRLQEAPGRAGADRMEAKAREYHEEVCKGFLEMAKAGPENFAVVDARGDVGTVAQRVRQAVKRVLK